MTKRSELKFQKHIIDSYKLHGGHARKWATELAVGVPDLVCSLPFAGAHLVEVKHRPDWNPMKTYKNPLTPKQIAVARSYDAAGAICFAFVILGVGGNAINSSCFAFNPLDEAFDFAKARKVPYINGKKFNVPDLVLN